MCSLLSSADWTLLAIPGNIRKQTDKTEVSVFQKDLSIRMARVWLFLFWWVVFFFVAFFL